MPIAVRPASRPMAPGRRRVAAAGAAIGLLVAAVGPPMGSAQGEVVGPSHLVVSEVVTGGASASDELIEIHNPTSSSLPLDGLEVIYVTSSGATISRRAAWGLDAGTIPAHGHLLIANEAGLYAPIADATYASGMASTGGSVAIRIQGAVTAIDAAGWGTTTSSWREGLAAPVPSAGSSIERIPGGALGSGQDTDDNAADFAVRPVPDPQNLGSAPTPSGGPIETAAPTPLPTPPAQTPVPTAQPAPRTTIAEARALADGETATIEGVAVAGSDFHDGGGFVADASGGIAVLVTDAAFARGARLRVTGELDDRFSQRTLRVDGADVTLLGTGVEPAVAFSATGAIGEAVEGRLVRIDAVVAGAASVLTSGLAFDVDDGSGATRVVVSSLTGIDASTWRSGTRIELVGVVGQRDSSGEGTAGYRIMPRDPGDLILVAPPATPAPTGSAAPDETPDPGSSPDTAGVSSIASARAAAKNARLTVRGVVTLPPGIVDRQTAVIQDGTGAIVLRLGDDVGRLALGERIEVHGTRSTKSGMETLRVTEPAVHLGPTTAPAARVVRTGEAGEPQEAQLVTVRGALATSARRSSTGSVTFDIDDGSGPLKIAFGASLGLDSSTFASGTWVEVSGVLGQETTGAQPDRGYRLWPRSTAEIRVVAAAGGGGGADAGDGGAGGSGTGAGSLDRVTAPNLADLMIGATLVAGPWPELHIGGLLWDGTSLVAIDERSADVVEAALGGRRPPIVLHLSGLTASGEVASLGVPRVVLGKGAGEVLAVASQPVGPAPLADAGNPGWASAVGRLAAAGSATELRVTEATIRLDHRCSAAKPPVAGRLVGVTGIAIGVPTRLIVPCGGIAPAPMARGRVAAAPLAAALRAPSPAASSATDGARRAIAAALLGVAGLGLAGLAAFFARRRRSASEPASPAALGPGGDDLTAGPRLALVRMPPEPGS